MTASSEIWWQGNSWRPMKTSVLKQDVKRKKYDNNNNNLEGIVYKVLFYSGL